MPYRERIQMHLKGVSRELSVAFATRAALRVLPFLSVGFKGKDPFWYWKVANRDNHLLAVLNAQRFGLAFSANVSEHATPFAAHATANAAYSAYTDAAYPPSENACLHTAYATAYAAHAYATSAYTADKSYTHARPHSPSSPCLSRCSHRHRQSPRRYRHSRHYCKSK